MTASRRTGSQATLNALSVIDSLGQGGAERSLLDLVMGLRDHGIDTTVAVMRVRQDGFHGALKAGSDLRIEVIGDKLPRAIRRLRAMLASGRFDLVHTSLFDATLVGRLAAWGSGVPVLTSLVNVSYDPVRLRDPNVSRIKLELARRIDGWTARRMNTRFHALTHAVAEQASIDLGIEEDAIVVIPRGRDPVEFRPAESPLERASIRSELGIDPDAVLFLNVGRHEFQKGHRFLLDAMTSVNDVVPGAMLLIVGREGNETTAIREQIARCGLDAVVEILGDRRDVNRIMRAADAFVFPSLYEGFGGSLIEAMATGLPLIASDLPPVREVVGGAGILVPPADWRSLAAAMGRVGLDRAELEALGSAGLARFQSNFRLDKVLSDMANLFWETSQIARSEVHG